MARGRLIYLACLVVVAALPAACLNGRGLVGLDSAVFDKLMGKFDVVLVKFDKYYPYGDEHEAFVQLSSAAAAIPHLLVAEVGVKDYGDHENQDLMHRFQLQFDQLPRILLFSKNSVEPVQFDDKAGVSVERVRQFVWTQAAVWISRSGADPQLDQLALQLLQLPEPSDGGGQLLEAARHRVQQLTTDAAATSKSSPERSVAAAASLYVTAMQRWMEDGTETARLWCRQQRERLDKMAVDAKMADRKRAELAAKSAVLQTFCTAAPPSSPPRHNEEL